MAEVLICSRPFSRDSAGDEKPGFARLLLSGPRSSREILSTSDKVVALGFPLPEEGSFFSNRENAELLPPKTVETLRISIDKGGVALGTTLGFTATGVKQFSTLGG